MDNFPYGATTFSFDMKKWTPVNSAPAMSPVAPSLTNSPPPPPPPPTKPSPRQCLNQGQFEFSQCGIIRYYLILSKYISYRLVVLIKLCNLSTYHNSKTSRTSNNVSKHISRPIRVNKLLFITIFFIKFFLFKNKINNHHITLTNSWIKFSSFKLTSISK